MLEARESFSLRSGGPAVQFPLLHQAYEKKPQKKPSKALTFSVRDECSLR